MLISHKQSFRMLSVTCRCILFTFGVLLWNGRGREKSQYVHYKKLHYTTATECSLDCWENHWYNPYSPRTVLIQSEQKGWQNHSDPLHQHTSSLNCYRLVDATELWASERPDTDTDTDTETVTVCSLKQSSHEHLTLNVEHTTLLYSYLFHKAFHTFFFQFKFAHVRPVTITRFKVQGFFICHIINYTGYNQKWNVNKIRWFTFHLPRMCQIIFLVCVNTWPIKLILILILWAIIVPWGLHFFDGVYTYLASYYV